MSETFRVHGIDRRRMARASIAIPVALTIDGKQYEGELVNLSETGALVNAPSRASEGAPATVTFSFDSDEARARRYEGRGQVVRSGDAVGIALTEMTGDLRGFVQTLTGVARA